MRSAHQFSFWDSVIVAAAPEADCLILYSEDMQHGQVCVSRTRGDDPHKRQLNLTVDALVRTEQLNMRCNNLD
ncbi:hypothetical protein CCR95_22975 [Thiocystis minor]|nr:hypothetical protein [Thiocystis minor]